MTNPNFTTHRADRIESDREVLPFPSGGVFGRTSPFDHESTVRNIERTLSTMQQQLDSLGDAVDDVLRFTEYAGDERETAPTPPTAA